MADSEEHSDHPLSKSERKEVRKLIKADGHRRWLKSVLLRWGGYAGVVLGILGTFWDKIVLLFRG